MRAFRITCVACYIGYERGGRRKGRAVRGEETGEEERDGRKQREDREREKKVSLSSAKSTHR
jgi:hypothetical protein